jgi:aromatic-L-amino-acid decarboxylase
MTQDLARRVGSDARFEIVAPHPLNLLCLAVRSDEPEAGNAATDRLIEAANATGDALFTRTVLDGRSVLRFSIGARSTEPEDVTAGWELLTTLVEANSGPPASGPPASGVPGSAS